MFPTYGVVARHLASYPSHLNRIAERKRQEAKNHGEYVDIHDFDGIAPDNYDVLITGVDDGKLRSEISQGLGIHCLGKATEDNANKVAKYIDGYVYGYR